MSTSIEQVLRCAQKNPYLQHVGFTVVSFTEEETVLKLTIRKEHHNVKSSLHGGVHAAMLDSVQSMMLRALNNTNVSIMNQNVQYLAGISDGNLYAKARVIQQGYKIAMTESEIMDENNRTIAKGTAVYKILRPE